MGQNCVASTSIGCLFCCKGCSAEKLRNAFTFMPPPSSYLLYDAEDEKKVRIAYQIEVLQQNAAYRNAADSGEVHVLKTKKGTSIPAVWLRHGNESPMVLVHCHGNATDMGMMMRTYYELSRVLGIDVFGVEYTGYGCSTGMPSSGNTFADVEAAYDFLIEKGVEPSRIVAYGQSVGSGPAAHLASKRPIGGVIFHSPLLSGIRVVDPLPESCCRPSCVWACFDFYPNERRVKTVTCPVFVLHGQRDDIIPFYHGVRLHEACGKLSKFPAYFPVRAGHNDIVETDARAYFGEMSRFLLEAKRRSDVKVAQAQATNPAGSVEMTQVNSTGSARGSIGALLETAGLLQPSNNGNGNARQLKAVDVAGPVPVGPTDGRYQQMRGGNMF